jgi:hypothetical protein
MRANQRVNNYRYTAFGLEIDSEIALQLPPPSGQTPPLGFLSIRFGDVGRCPDDLKEVASFLYSPVDKDLFVRLPKVASFLITDGIIFVSPEQQIENPVIPRFLVSGALGIYLMKRKTLLLHGSAVVKANKAICLLGDQGSGKSTTAAMLATEGLPVLCDDLIPLSSEDMTVMPGVPRPKLLLDAFSKLGRAYTLDSALFDGVDKYQVCLGEAKEIVSLGCLVILTTKPELSKISVEKIQGMDKVSTLLSHTSVLEGVVERGELFQRLCKLLNNTIGVYRITRPCEGNSLLEVAKTILDLV